MNKSFLALLCLSLAGILLLSACNGGGAKTEVTVTASPTSSSMKTATQPVKATPTKVLKSTQSTVLATKTTRVTATPTLTQTLTAAQSAAEINSLLKTLVDDLANTELVSETDIP